MKSTGLRQAYTAHEWHTAESGFRTEICCRRAVVSYPRCCHLASHNVTSTHAHTLLVQIVVDLFTRNRTSQVWASVGYYWACVCSCVRVCVTSRYCINTAALMESAGADLGFYKGGCPIHLKGALEVERWRRQGGWVWEVAVPLPRKFLHFLYQNGEFLCIPGDIYWHCNWLFI